MHRRSFLSTATLAAGGVVGLAGCGGSSGTDGPTPTPIEEISIDPEDYELGAGDIAEGELTVSGTVVRKPILGVVLTDGTGYADVSARYSDEEVNHDVVEVGDCLAGTGHVNLRQSTTDELPTVEVTELADGSDCPDADPLPEPPRPDFETDWDYRDEEFTVTFAGGEQVTAGNLVVRWRGGESDTFWTAAERATWADLADVPAEEPVPEGSQIVFERSSLDVSVLWTDPERARRREIESVGVSAA